MSLYIFTIKKQDAHDVSLTVWHVACREHLAVESGLRFWLAEASYVSSLLVPVVSEYS